MSSTCCNACTIATWVSTDLKLRGELVHHLVPLPCQLLMCAYCKALPALYIEHYLCPICTTCYRNALTHFSEFKLFAIWQSHLKCYVSDHNLFAGRSFTPLILKPMPSNDASLPKNVDGLNSSYTQLNQDVESNVSMNTQETSTESTKSDEGEESTIVYNDMDIDEDVKIKTKTVDSTAWPKLINTCTYTTDHPLTIWSADKNLFETILLALEDKNSGVCWSTDTHFVIDWEIFGPWIRKENTQPRNDSIRRRMQNYHFCVQERLPGRDIQLWTHKKGFKRGVYCKFETLQIFTKKRSKRPRGTMSRRRKAND